MKCAKARDLFSSYLENEMDVPTSVQFEQHLSECPKCKADYDRFNAAVVMLDEVPEVDPPANFHASVMSRVEQLRGTAPSPVKWWQIDWQHVFTIRVPARAAAFALVALMLVAVLVQVTPVGTGVMNLLGLQRVSQKTIGERTPDTAPPWSLKPEDAVYDMSGSGLLISVTSRADASTRTYALRLQCTSEKPVAFYVEAGDRTYGGSVVRDQDSIIHVPVRAGQDVVVARVRWNYGDRTHIQYVYLPYRFDPKAHAKQLHMVFENMTVGAIIREVATDYGVVVLASGDLSKKVSYADVDSGNPGEALYHCIELSDVNMKQQMLAPSIYVVEPVE